MKRILDLQVNKKTILFLIWILIYMFALSWGYAHILAGKVQYFQLDFVLWKYLIGSLWIIVLFLNIRHEERTVSSFLLNFHLIIGIIPIAVIYSLCNGSTAYFTVLCIAYLVAELLVKVKWKKEGFSSFYIERFTQFVLFGCMLVVLGILGYTFMTNGLPTLTALNFSDVYDLRGDGYFITNEYLNYIYRWTMAVFLPFLLAYFLVKQRYLLATICVMISFVFYLYSGNKTNLFLIPLVIGVYIFAQYKDTNYRFYGLFTLVLALTVPLTTLANFYMPFSLFVRRTLVIPANLKFVYYDFFSNNPKLGLSGTLWGSKLGVTYPYEKKIGYIISEEYFGLPNMNSNTGFLAEGFSRFGYVGIFLVLILFAMILILLDRLQRRTGYTFAVTMSVYPIFTLNDGQLIDSLIFGPMLVLLLVILLYHDNHSKEGEELQWRRRILPRISI